MSWLPLPIPALLLASVAHLCPSAPQLVLSIRTLSFTAGPCSSAHTASSSRGILCFQ